MKAMPEGRRMMGCRHTPCPAGYLEWHDWAEKKEVRNYQTRCKVCGAWAVWKRKVTEPEKDDIQ